MPHATQHYTFAHLAVPEIARARASWLMTVLAGPEGQALVDDIWQRCGDDVGPEGRYEPSGETPKIKFAGLRGGGVIAVITMPPPKEAAHAHFVALVGKTFDEQAAKVSNLSWLRVFLLEQPAEGTGPEPTVLAEWGDKQEHIIHGPGPAPSEEAFIKACVQQLWKEMPEAAN